MQGAKLPVSPNDTIHMQVLLLVSAVLLDNTFIGLTKLGKHSFPPCSMCPGITVLLQLPCLKQKKSVFEAVGLSTELAVAFHDVITAQQKVHLWEKLVKYLPLIQLFTIESKSQGLEGVESWVGLTGGSSYFH